MTSCSFHGRQNTFDVYIYYNNGIVLGNYLLS